MKGKCVICMIEEDFNKTHTWICEIKENDNIDSYYLIKEKRIGTTRRGDIFLNIIIADKSGEVEGKVWDNVEEISQLFAAGDIVRVQGIVSSFKNQLQIKIVGLEKTSRPFETSIFIESSNRLPSEMLAELQTLLASLKNKNLKNLCRLFLNDENFIDNIKQWPAAKAAHHAYLGGLLEHTLSVCKLAEKIGEHYEDVIDKEILLVGAFIHDIGKIEEFSIRNGIDYTNEGRLIGHIVLGIRLLDAKIDKIKDFPEDLKITLEHIIASHHGELNFGSPKRPKILEAIVIHLLDDIDAKINGISKFMAKDRNSGSWTEYNRLLERFFFKGNVIMENIDKELAKDKLLEESDDELAAFNLGKQTSLFN